MSKFKRIRQSQIPRPVKKAENKFVLLEVEGYYVGHKFYIKELGTLNLIDNTVSNYFIQTPKIHGTHYDWLVKHYHRIPYFYYNVEYKYIYKLLNQSNITYFIKGARKQFALQKLTNNRVINLEYLDCPSISKLPQSLYIPCKFHSNYPTEHCTLVKLAKLSEWIFRYINENESTNKTIRRAHGPA